MKVRVTLDLDDEARAAINHRAGRPGKATREECAEMLFSLLYADMEQVVADYNAADDSEADEG